MLHYGYGVATKKNSGSSLGDVVSKDYSPGVGGTQYNFDSNQFNGDEKVCRKVSRSISSNKKAAHQCCCGCSLRTGSILIGWFKFVECILWLISISVGASYYGLDYLQLTTFIIAFITTLMILVATYAHNPKVLWSAVYLEIIFTLWILIFAIIYLCFESYVLGSVGVMIFIISFYYVIILSMHGHEIDAEIRETLAPA